MNYKIDKCPVCGINCMAGEYDHKDKKEVDCERCGKFKISMGGLSLSNFYKYKDGFAILSYYIKNFLKPDELLSSENINTILENNKLPSYEIKYNNLLTWLANESNYSTKSIADKTYKLASLIGAVDSSEFTQLLYDIWDNRLIEVDYPTIGYFKKFGSTDDFRVRLTTNGIKKVKEGLEKKNIINTGLVFEYDIVFSFAGEDRAFVEEITKYLKDVKFFYDKYEESKLWGKNLFDYLDDIYRNSAKYCVMILSEHYARKLWTNHERKSAQARAFKQNQEYILPIKLDYTEIPGILPTINYVNGREKTSEQIANMILEKLNKKNKDDAHSKRDIFNKLISPNIKASLKVEVNSILKRIYANTEKLSLTISDCLLLSKRIDNKELERYCAVELNGIKSGGYYPEFFYRKMVVFASIEQLNIDILDLFDLTKLIEIMERDTERFLPTKIFAWQPINELEELVLQDNLDKKLISFKMTPKELNIKHSNPNMKISFYAKANEYQKIISRSRNRLTEILLKIINE